MMQGMYLRTTRRRNGDGSEVRYLSLAHNEWDHAAGRSKVRILFNFGREDGLDPAAIRRLIGSLSRALPAGEALAAAMPSELRYLESRPLGGAHLLDGLWSRLGLHEILARLLRGRRLDPAAERTLFAMVANRALEPLSKLSCAAWVDERVTDRGFASAQNRRYLQRAGGHYTRGRSSGATRPRRRPRSRARAATTSWRATSRSRRSSSTTARCATASSSAATRPKRSVTPRSAGSAGWWAC